MCWSFLKHGNTCCCRGKCCWCTYKGNRWDSGRGVQWNGTLTGSIGSQGQVLLVLVVLGTTCFCALLLFIQMSGTINLLGRRLGPTFCLSCSVLKLFLPTVATLEGSLAVLALLARGPSRCHTDRVWQTTCHAALRLDVPSDYSDRLTLFCLTANSVRVSRQVS